MGFEPRIPSIHGPRERGELFADTFEDPQGKKFCTEYALRAKTMDIYLSQLESEKKYLLKRLREGETDAPIRQRIHALDRAIMAYGDTQASWASTVTPRLLFAKLDDKEEAKSTEIPLLGNLRVYRVEFADGTSTSLNGSAAVSDFIHSQTNLSELRDYLALSNAGTMWNLTEENREYFKHFYGYNPQKGHGYRQVKEMMEHHILQAYGKEGDLKIDHATVVQAAAERTTLLRRQVLQDLYLHLVQNPVSNPAVLYGRTALLDATKDPVTDKETGYTLNEKNQLMDMMAIYRDLNGLPISFDLQESEGPYIDDQGTIHMPKNCCTEEFRRAYPNAHLRTLLLNVSVQGNTANSGLQYWTNSAALAELEQWPMTDDQRRRFDLLRHQLTTTGKTDFNTAHQVIRFIRELGYCSVDCYGGKDRTGYTIALDVFHTISEKMAGMGGQARQQAVHKRLAEIGMQLLSDDGIAVRVAEDNSGHKALKLSKADLELYFSGTGLQLVLGAGKRILDYVKTGIHLVADKVSDEPYPVRPSVLYSQDETIEKVQKYKARRF